MSKITNDGLTRSGTGCFIAVRIWQQWRQGAKKSEQTFRASNIAWTIVVVDVKFNSISVAHIRYAGRILTFVLCWLYQNDCAQTLVQWP